MIVIDETQKYLKTIEYMNLVSERHHPETTTKRLLVDGQWLLFVSVYQDGWFGSVSCLDSHQMTKPEFEKLAHNLSYHRIIPKYNHLSINTFPLSKVIHFRPIP